jgi:hypothetical protein
MPLQVPTANIHGYRGRQGTNGCTQRQRFERLKRGHMPALPPAPEPRTVARIHAVLESNLIDDARIARRRQPRDELASHYVRRVPRCVKNVSAIEPGTCRFCGTCFGTGSTWTGGRRRERRLDIRRPFRRSTARARDDWSSVVPESGRPSSTRISDAWANRCRATRDGRRAASPGRMPRAPYRG